MSGRKSMLASRVAHANDRSVVPQWTVRKGKHADFAVVPMLRRKEADTIDPVRKAGTKLRRVAKEAV